MSLQCTLRAVALASVSLLPLTALAQEGDFGVEDAPVKKETAAPDFNNQATVGLRYQSDSSALGNRFSGEQYKGLSGVGSFQLQDRDAWNSGGTTYFELQGKDLDINNHQLLPNGYGEFKYGQQGDWGVKVYIDDIRYLQSTNFHSLNTSDGALRVAPRSIPSIGLGTAAAGAATSSPASAFTATTSPLLGATQAQIVQAQTALNRVYAGINANNSPIRVGTERTAIGAAGNWAGPEGWTFTAGLNHEHKEGTKENSFTTNHTSNINYFPEPVNYDTDRYSLAAAYSTKVIQGSLSYTYNKFTDNQAAFATQNPFYAGTTYAPGYTGTLYSLPPSSDAHQFKGQLGYNITPTTRLNTNLGYQLMLQNSAETMAYSGAAANPNLTSNTGGKVQDFFGNVALSSRPFSKVDLRASYTVDDRVNDTTRVFIPASGVMYTADTTNSSDTPITNLPVSVLKQNLSLEGGYRIVPSTKLSVNYSLTDKQQDYSVTNHTRENSVGARVNSSLASDINAMFSVSHSVRTAAAYNSNNAWVSSTYSDRNVANLGMYYLDARTRDEAKTHLSAGVTSDITVGVNGSFYYDHYPEAAYGYSNDHGFTMGPDVTYSPNKALQAHLFYTFEEVFSDQNAITSTSTTAARTDWTLGNQDTIHTVGFDTSWQVNDDLKLKFHENLSYGATQFQEGYQIMGTLTNNYQLYPGNLALSLPTSKTFTNGIGLNGEYKLTESLTLLGGYDFDMSLAKDYLYSQSAGSTANGNNVSSLGGDGNPTYRIQTVYTGVRVKW